MIRNLNSKKKINPMLLRVVFISILIHIAFAFVAGFISIASYVIKENTMFEEPPAIDSEEIPKEVKVQISPPKPQQDFTRDLKVQQIGNIAVDELNMNLPNMSDNFTVSGGVGTSVSGNLLGGARGSIGLGISSINVFGLKTRAERVLFLVDTNRRMVTDAKGGLNSYRVIKEEIFDMVSNLSPGTLFNVIFYDHRRFKFFKPKLVPSGLEVSAELSRWFSKINSSADNIGLANVSDTVVPELTALDSNEIQDHLQWWNGHNDMAYTTALALEQNADAIFMITGYHRGFGKIVAPPGQKQLQDWENLKKSKEYQEQLAKFLAEESEMRARVDRELAKINADRAKKGQPPRVLAQGRNDVRGNARELGLDWKNPHPPGGPGHQDINQERVIKYFKDLLQKKYSDRGVKPPSVNVVLFLAGDEAYRESWQLSLDQYIRFFKGKRRIIRGANEIISARTSKSSKN